MTSLQLSGKDVFWGGRLGIFHSHSVHKPVATRLRPDTDERLGQLRLDQSWREAAALQGCGRPLKDHAAEFLSPRKMDEPPGALTGRATTFPRDQESC